MNTVAEEFNAILCEIAYGLKSKVEMYDKMRRGAEAERPNSDGKRYVKDEYLLRSINKFAAFAYKNQILDNAGNMLIPKNETEAIEKYFSIPVRDWIKMWGGIWNVQLADFMEMDELIATTGTGKFILQELCYELAASCVLYNQDKAQNRVYNLLRRLKNQKAYESGRRFFIENPIIDSGKVKLLERELGACGIDQEAIKNIKEAAYEPIPSDAVAICGYCGWTVSKKSDEDKQCINWRCRSRTDNFTKVKALTERNQSKRLCPGVMRYIAIPGKLELEIEAFCKANKVEYFLWPHLDSYDLKITLPNQIVCVIDAKDYRNAFHLIYDLDRGRKLFNEVNWDKGYIVVPDEVLEIKHDYCMVVNRKVEMIAKNVKCVTVSELKAEIKEGIRDDKK